MENVLSRLVLSFPWTKNFKSTYTSSADEHPVIFELVCRLVNTSWTSGLQVYGRVKWKSCLRQRAPLGMTPDLSSLAHWRFIGSIDRFKCENQSGWYSRSLSFTGTEQGASSLLALQLLCNLHVKLCKPSISKYDLPWSMLVGKME